MSQQMLDEPQAPRELYVLSYGTIRNWALLTVTLTVLAGTLIVALSSNNYWHDPRPKRTTTAAPGVAKSTATPGPLAWMDEADQDKSLKVTFAIPADRTPAQHLDILCAKIRLVADTYPSRSGIPAATSTNCALAKSALANGDSRSTCNSAIRGALNITYDSRLNTISKGDMAFACGDNHTLTHLMHDGKALDPVEDAPGRNTAF